MTVTHYQPRQPACSQVAARHRTALDDLSDAMHSFFSTLRLWRQRMRERDQLGRLDDRMLQDIGITRADALHLSSKPFWRE
jgi:uncharacterized protein YjiS (DUF1127 family)